MPIYGVARPRYAMTEDNHEIDQQYMDRLRSLGYIGTRPEPTPATDATPTPAPPSASPSPAPSVQSAP